MVQRRTLLATGLTAVGLAGCNPPSIPFHGLNQAGIATPPQAHALLTAYPLGSGTGSQSKPGNAAIPALLKTNAAALTAASTSRLTLTFGVASSQWPTLPAFPADRLDPARCGGDLLIQACGDDPAELIAATAALTQLTGTQPSWQCLGYQSPRNAFGFRDGTVNPTDLDRHVWTDDGGSFVIVRQIAMDLAKFGSLKPESQEKIIGRRRDTGIPLGGRTETDPINLYARHPDGTYVIPADAHVRLADARFDGGAQMLRRGYTYAHPGETGLLFIAYLRDPALFVRVQHRLDSHDALRNFTQARGSAVFRIPPGTGPAS